MAAESAGFGDYEFERRFFVSQLPAEYRQNPTLIVQSYFLADHGYALRVRCQASGIEAQHLEQSKPVDILRKYADYVSLATVTVKGPSGGGTRYEAEREIDKRIGIEMVARGGNRIVKTRYSTWIDEDGWVVDVFGGRNSGLIIAECERASPVTKLAIPAFCQAEVTDDYRFSNEELAGHPWPSFRDSYLSQPPGPHAGIRKDLG